MREEFEKLPEIAEYINTGYYEFISNESGYYSDVEGVSTTALDLAWCAFQERQKKIDMQECGATEIKMILNNNVYGDAEKIERIKELLK